MDLTIQAVSGLIAATGFPDGPPVQAGPAVVDFISGIHLYAATLKSPPSANATYARCIASASGWGGAGPTSASVSRADSRPRGSKGPWGSTLSEDLA
jgi:hypothetical protein